jgi:ABC-type multidrug transport system fused ATPase/permease subunit
MQIPIITGFLVDNLANSNPSHFLGYGFINTHYFGNTTSDVLYFGLVSLLVVSILYGITGYFRVFLRSSISRNFMYEIQRDLVEKLEFLSLNVHKRYGSGNFLNHIIADTNNVRPFVETTIIKTATNIVRISYPLIILFIINPFLALVAFSILPPLLITIRIMQSKLSDTLKRQRKDRSQLTTLLKETLDNIDTIQSSGAEKWSIEKITRRIGKIETAQIRSQNLYGFMIGMACGLTSLGIAAIWWFGAHQVLANNITLGQLVMFSGFLLFAYEPVRYFTRNIKDHRRSLIALKHIQKFLNLASSVEENKHQSSLNITDGRIQLENIFFSLKEVNKSTLPTNSMPILSTYFQTNQKDKNYILENFSLDLDPRRITAIVGKSGSGKSSILKLIMRLYDPNSGRVLIDNQNLKFVSLSSLRQQVSLVPQTSAIFSGTIMNNICLTNPDASRLEVEEICSNIDASGFINKLDKGLDTIVGQKGIHLSGGEIQKIALARALLKRPKILLLDEPISSVDSDSGKMIKQRLTELKSHMTIVIIDHEPSSVDFVDDIITIENGMVVNIERKRAVMKFESHT